MTTIPEIWEEAARDSDAAINHVERVVAENRQLLSTLRSMGEISRKVWLSYGASEEEKQAALSEAESAINQLVSNLSSNNYKFFVDNFMSLQPLLTEENTPTDYLGMISAAYYFQNPKPGEDSSTLEKLVEAITPPEPE